MECSKKHPKYWGKLPCVGGDWVLAFVRLAPFIIVVLLDTSLFYQVCRRAPVTADAVQSSEAVLSSTFISSLEHNRVCSDLAVLPRRPVRLRWRSGSDIGGTLRGFGVLLSTFPLLTVAPSMNGFRGASSPPLSPLALLQVSTMMFGLFRGLFKLDLGVLTAWDEVVKEFYKAPYRWWFKCMSEVGNRNQLALLRTMLFADSESGAIVSDGRMFKKAVLTPEEIMGTKKRSVNVVVRHGTAWACSCGLSVRRVTAESAVRGGTVASKGMRRGMQRVGR